MFQGRTGRAQNRAVAKSGNDLEAKLDALYAAPLAEFVGARHALAKSLEASGRKEDAARIAALRKPSAAAWAVNQLAFSDKGPLQALVAASGRLRRNTGDVRDALRERRQALNEAAKAAERALASSGHKPTSDVQRRISATLESIAAHAGAEGGPEAGRLSEDVPAPGFDEIASLGLLGGAAPATSRTAPTPPPPAKATGVEPPKISSKKILARERALEEKRRRDDAKRAAALKKGAQVARAQLAAAEKAALAARRRKASLEAALAEAAAEVKRLEAEVADARAALDAAEGALEEKKKVSRSGLVTPRPAGR